MEQGLEIRDASNADFAAWRSLWTSYCAFYDASLDDAMTSSTWQRILDPDFPMHCRLAFVDQTCAGFAVTVLHAGTWVSEPICYLEDLFVTEVHRTRGIGRLLLQDLIALCKAKSYARLYWHTKATNAAARRLYDRFATADDFVRYQIKLT